MLCPSMEDKVFRELDVAEVVTVDHCRIGHLHPQILQWPFQPNRFACYNNRSFVLGLNARQCHCRLFFAAPGDHRTPQGECITRCWLVITNTSGPIAICVADQLFGYTYPLQQPMILSAANISQYPSHAQKMLDYWLRHKLIDQVDQIVEVQSGDRQVDEASNNLPELCHVASRSWFVVKLDIPV